MFKFILDSIDIEIDSAQQLPVFIFEANFPEQIRNAVPSFHTLHILFKFRDKISGIKNRNLNSIQSKNLFKLEIGM